MNGCRCDDHNHYLDQVEGRWFLRCTSCTALTVSIPVTTPRRGATVVDPVRFRDACEGITPAARRAARIRQDSDRVALIVVLLLIVAFVVAWNRGGAL